MSEIFWNLSNNSDFKRKESNFKNCIFLENYLKDTSIEGLYRARGVWNTSWIKQGSYQDH